MLFVDVSQPFIHKGSDSQTSDLFTERTERSPALGTKGDLMLLSPQLYLIKDGCGPIAASSEHIYFLSNKTVFKIVWNVDGKPWLTKPIGLEGTTGSTISPFVILN
jgi:hypothetical protein